MAAIGIQPMYIASKFTCSRLIYKVAVGFPVLLAAASARRGACICRLFFPTCRDAASTAVGSALWVFEHI